MEFFFRRNCELFVLSSKVYENVSGALEDDRYVVCLTVFSELIPYPNSISIRGLGIEVRFFSETGERKEIVFLDCQTHEMVMAYLDNSFLYFDKAEYERINPEFDQDRRVYVMYVKPSGVK